MRLLLVSFLIVSIMVSCQDHESVTSDFTGNESTYPLLAGSDYPVSGTVTFKEKKDKSVLITLSITGTEGDIKHPVHLHMGNISTPNADISALLNPVNGQTGKSETSLAQLADESTITYQQLLNLNACIKVHLSASGPDKDIVLAGGNIGTAAESNVSSGRAAINVCKSK